MLCETKFDKLHDIKAVDVLPLEAYDTALMYRTGIVPPEAITTNKTFNGATLGQIKGRITDPFLEMEISKLPNLFTASKNTEGNPEKSKEAENENSQK